ncbi:L,D-transpeptidase family protein [Sphingomonas sp. BN140010]|uniref:L,D-transpeptidase family protein n=1 Tax=Sphingomonas arvum TaxID=2992113 RepID=A0ABT3JIC5_9SPHN|nr:L,D-transpeptidase family protein [Sphingomonas sp. BN140010]MCW3798490.1 L,D-transpeptidase family protein [Sphingomonas sp. BN140010]
MVRHLVRCLIAGALFGLAAPAAAGSGAKVSSPVALAREAQRLKPGEWVWAPNLARTGPVLVYVDLDAQRATVYRNGVRIAVSTVSSGKTGHETPTGVFTILEKHRDHRSRTYDDAPMPNMQRLTGKGVALHAGNLPGFPASHGCVRLPLEFSRLLFGITDLGGTVVIAGNHADPVRRRAAGVLAPGDIGGPAARRLPLGSAQDYSWNPALSPTGPVSIIVSTGDQQVVVLRNGVEIGRARAIIRDQALTPQVLTMVRSPGRTEWLQVGVSAVRQDGGEVISTRSGEITSTQGVERMGLPAPFAAAMKSVMAPGTTVLVTRAGVDAQTTGGAATVIESEPGSRR